MINTFLKIVFGESLACETGTEVPKMKILFQKLQPDQFKIEMKSSSYKHH